MIGMYRNPNIQKNLLSACNGLLLIVPAYLRPDCRGSSLCRDSQISFSPKTSSSSAEGSPTCYQVYRDTLSSPACPGLSPGSPRTPLEGGAHGVPGKDVKATNKLNSSWCGGEAALLRASPRRPSSSPLGRVQPPCGESSFHPLVSRILFFRS